MWRHVLALLMLTTTVHTQEVLSLPSTQPNTLSGDSAPQIRVWESNQGGIVRRGRRQKLAIDFICPGCPIARDHTEDGLVIGSLRVGGILGLTVQPQSGDRDHRASGDRPTAEDLHAPRTFYRTREMFYRIEADRDMPLGQVT